MKGNKIIVQIVCYVCGAPAVNLIDESSGGRIDIKYVCDKHSGKTKNAIR